MTDYRKQTTEALRAELMAMHTAAVERACKTGDGWDVVTALAETIQHAERILDRQYTEAR